MAEPEKAVTVLVTELRVSQVFVFRDAEDGNTYRWDATEGRRLAEARRAEIVSVRLEDIGATPEAVLKLCPGLDVRKALRLPGAALLSPLLFVPHRGKHVLIDGMHRLYRAACAGMPCLPAYVLTQGEERRIRLEAEDVDENERPLWAAQ